MHLHKRRASASQPYQRLRDELAEERSAGEVTRAFIAYTLLEPTVPEVVVNQAVVLEAEETDRHGSRPDPIPYLFFLPALVVHRCLEKV